MNAMDEEIRYVASSGDVRIAWTVSGRTSPTLVFAPNHFTNIIEDWEHFARAPIVKGLADRFRVVRMDQRGCGLSTRGAVMQSVAAWADDIDAVARAASPGQPVVLFALSQGAGGAIEFAATRPYRVSHLVIVGGYARVSSESQNPIAQSPVDLLANGLSSPNPGFRMLLNAGFALDASRSDQEWLEASLDRAIDAESLGPLVAAMRSFDVRSRLAHIMARTLVMHISDDLVIPKAGGEEIARGVPGARFVELPGRSHMIRESEGALQAMFAALDTFIPAAAPRTARAAPKELSQRERDLVHRLCQGATNAAIAQDLGLSEKTVRNQLSLVFEKLGVSSRTQAVAKILSDRKG
jgi:pimeloyl-ACP methyl ester carboxylesterase/DNA-binding CsgD family transcriptional regulator